VSEPPEPDPLDAFLTQKTNPPPKAADLLGWWVLTAYGPKLIGPNGPQTVDIEEPGSPD
jgi:hypothetical protein